MDHTTGTIADPLYVALDKYEDASNNVGVLTITTQGRFRALTDAIGGHGDLAEALAGFRLEAALLADAHQQWTGAAQIVTAAVSDASDWQHSFTVTRRCESCGTPWSAKDPWLYPHTCNNCVADRQPQEEIVSEAEAVMARERADDDAAARRAYYS